MQNAALQLEPSARLWFGKGLFVYALAYLLAFAGIGFAVASVFEWGTNDNWKDPKLQTILVPIDFMISWIYFLLLRDSLEGYSSPAESYTRLLCLCYTLASRTVCLTHHSHSLLFRGHHARAALPARPAPKSSRASGSLVRRMRSARGQEEGGFTEVDAPDDPLDETVLSPPIQLGPESFMRSGRPLGSQFPPDMPYAEFGRTPGLLRSVGGAEPVQASVRNEHEMQMALYNIRDACMVIVWYAFRLYRPEDAVPLEVVHVSRHGRATNAGLQALVADNRDNPLGLLRHLVSFIAYNLGMLSHGDELNTSEHNLINEAFIELSKQLDGTQVNAFTRNPRILKQHLFWVMAVFLLLWVPFQLWIVLGWTLTVIFYPLIMYLLSGPFIYRSFLGESFDLDSKAGLMDHDAQRREAVNDIRNLFDPQHSPVRYGLLSFGAAPPPTLSPSHVPSSSPDLLEPESTPTPLGYSSPTMTLPSLPALGAAGPPQANVPMHYIQFSNAP